MSGPRVLRTEALEGRQRYRLLTSLVVPRPIGWIGSYDAGGQPNLAPFSYFNALAASPMLVGASVGMRRGAEPGSREEKDTLLNIRETEAFGRLAGSVIYATPQRRAPAEAEGLGVHGDGCAVEHDRPLDRLGAERDRAALEGEAQHQHVGGDRVAQHRRGDGGGVEEVEPGWLGAQMVVSGLPDFSRVPPSARLQSEAGTTLCIDMQNRPCHLPARVVERERPGAGAAFKRAAEGLRGVTAWIEREGVLAVGDGLRLFVPDQPPWTHRDA